MLPFTAEVEISDSAKILKSNNIDFKFKDYNIKEIKELRKLINNIVI